MTDATIKSPSSFNGNDDMSQPQDIYELSNLPKNQLWFWIGQTLDPDTPYFNMPMAITIHGAVEHERFQRAFEQVVKRSDALRTVVETIDGIPQRRVLDSMDSTVKLIDYSGESDPQAAFDEWANERCRRMFDMAGCMFEAVLVKLADERYIWYWCQHHLVCDGWSTALVYRYVSEFYAASFEQDLDSLPPFPAYEDYAAREREYRHSADHDKSREFWEQQLAESLDTLQIYGRTARDHGTTTVARVTRDLGQARTDGLKKLASAKPFISLSSHLGQFQIVSTCLLAYLYRITGNEQLALGSLYHNRQTPADKDTIGFFMEMAPLRIKADKDDSFEDLFLKVRATTYDVMRHYRFAPGNAINKRSYDVALNYNNASYPPFAGLPMSLHWLHANAWYAHEPLAIQIHDFDKTGTFTVAFDFNCGVFDKDNQERVIRHFFACIDAIIADPSAGIASFPLLDADEAHQLAEKFGRGPKADFPDKQLHEVFSDRAKTCPDKVAVYSQNESLSYSELDAKSNQLAAYLVEQGIAVGDRIGISLTREPQLLVALFGALKAGAGYVPLDPDYPDERLSFMIEDAGIKVLISEESLADDLPAGNAKVLLIDQEWNAIAATGNDFTAVATGPDDLAYIIYTSGSTGQSKGVMIEHGAIVNYVFAAMDTYDINADDRTLQFASISFDTAGEEIYPTLVAGGTLYLPDDNIFASAEDFVEICEREKLTFLDLPTAFWHQIVTPMVEDGLQLPDFTRLLIIGGERALPQFVQDWLQHDRSGARLFNTYGPTESTIVATACELTTANSDADREVPIGQPVTNMVACVLDQNQQRVPVGVCGELLVGGPGLARGYMNRPDLTEDRFVTLNAETPDAERWYKTGDLVRYRRNGLLEYRDRIDDQVKVRGYRIEIGDVESALRKVPGVSNCVVTASEFQPGDRRLVAYYLLNQASAMTQTEVRQALKGLLPDYMVPQHYIEIDELPMSPNGKVDRKALPAPFGKQSPVAAVGDPPKTEAERQIASVWAAVLKTDAVSRNDNFFDLGGHSLLMMQLIAQMQKTIGFTATPRMIVAQDLAQIALEFEAQGGANNQAEVEVSAPSQSLFSRVVSAVRGGR